MTTTELKKRILLNFISSIIEQPATHTWMSVEVEKYIKDSPDEIQKYLDDKAMTQIIHGNN